MCLTQTEYNDMQKTLQRLKEDINKPVNIHNRILSIKALEMVLTHAQVEGTARQFSSIFFIIFAFS